MRIALACFVLAVVGLTISSVAWMRAPVPVLDDPTGALVREVESRPVDIAARYAGRSELLDPQYALPAWHRFAREEAVRLHEATRSCPAPEAQFDDARLAKAYAVHVALCNHLPVRDLDRAPFMHPSGRSFASMAKANGAEVPAADFHVLELASAPLVDDSDRLLASVPRDAWEAIARGDRIVITPGSIVRAEHGPLGLGALHFSSKASFDAWSSHRSIALRPRVGACAAPASPSLCWERTDRGSTAKLGAFASLGLLVTSSIALLVLYVRERRRAHADRIHILRTLTHELRTPATHLRLDIEPIRDAYDELPAHTQEPLLRISDGIERLQRVLHLSARYMALFESDDPVRLAKRTLVPSVKEMFEGFAEEWPEDVVLVGAEDGAMTTDPEWLGVALRNLVENAHRHGKKPVRVEWALADDLVVKVIDGGTTPGLSLRKAKAPHARDPNSPGLGLGLSIADRAAKLLGGKLAHAPSPTTFTLRVPK